MKNFAACCWRWLPCFLWLLAPGGALGLKMVRCTFIAPTTARGTTAMGSGIKNGSERGAERTPLRDVATTYEAGRALQVTNGDMDRRL